MPEESEGEQSRFGRRLEDLSEDERAYYRDFLPPSPTPPTSTADEPAWQRPTQKPKKPLSRWFWFPHALTALALITALASFTVVPAVYSDISPELRRNYVIMWAELAFFFLLFAALLYGIFALARFTDHDDEDDDRLVRPTDYAERLYEKDIARAQKNLPDSGFYDSSWVSGKKD
ncbi:hypothetical protein [Rothia endophytica]|uniref:hypothetical protein n=1 Tax=Rothia endophytica TaxID=1324766 RepID=UPI001F3DBC92|nr:hypothetical protein [Rothia endophytica]